MTIICDSREQKWDHVLRYLERSGIRWLRSKLPVGDYGRMDNLSVVVDRKASLTEVEGNLIQQHERFRNEAKRAKENGIHLIVLVEAHGIHSLDDVECWVNPRRTRWEKIDQAHANGRMLKIKISQKPPVDGIQLAQIMRTMAEKYGLEWRFCSHQDAGKKILELLGVDADAAGGGNDQTGDSHANVPAKRWRAC